MLPVLKIRLIASIRRKQLEVHQSTLFRQHTADIAANIEGFLDATPAEQIARQTGFIKRSSTKLSADGFINTLMVSESPQSQISLPDLTAILRQSHGIEISKEALHQRFNPQAVAFLEKILQQALQQHLLREKGSPKLHFPRIKIKDSTKFKLPTDYNGAYRGYGNFSKTNGMISLQYEYDLVSGHWLSLQLTEGLRNDLTDTEQTTSAITAGDLHIRDLGYVSSSYLKAVVQSKAFFLNRLPPQAGVHTLQGKPLDWNKVLDKAACQQHLQQEVLLYDTERIPCRLIIERVPDHEFKRRLQNAQARAKSKGWSVSKAYKKRLHYNIYTTNVGADILPACAVRKTYYLRWQIELVFKTWKSFFDISDVKKVKKERLECQLLGRLLWILLNWSLFSRLNRHVAQMGQAVSLIMFFKRSLQFAYSLRMVLLNKLSIVEWLENTYLPLVIDCVCSPPKGKHTHFQTLEINKKS
ncbi:MAG: IS4 family transposase [Chitinophagaceae bacterium]|nr:IS4 family transposase [Chitinophagaceae bacterium]MBX3239152.1 IS4 family transposase [Chitinophagaceae bacterium]MBX3240372.1 IS4 family transposase [Chitinophagaceae bacterium]MBX3241913.1 IS4 family transposase [Chitinophagaceae bacterium]MBX3242383.1 IS4 family transposase [Chitinophagaceae bacterium]